MMKNIEIGKKDQEKSVRKTLNAENKNKYYDYFKQRKISKKKGKNIDKATQIKYNNETSCDNLLLMKEEKNTRISKSSNPFKRKCQIDILNKAEFVKKLKRITVHYSHFNKITKARRNAMISSFLRWRKARRSFYDRIKFEKLFCDDILKLMEKDKFLNNTYRQISEDLDKKTEMIEKELKQKTRERFLVKLFFENWDEDN